MAMSPDRPEAGSHTARDLDIQGWMTEYGPALRSYFRRRVNEAEADDLVQEVFLTMHARTSSEPIENIRGYLFRVAVSVLARRDRMPDAFDPFQEGQEPIDDISPERIVSGRQELERLMVAIGNLPPRTRTAFVLHRFGQMTYVTVARRMGIKSDAVKAHLSRAILKLTQELGRLP